MWPGTTFRGRLLLSGWRGGVARALRARVFARRVLLVAVNWNACGGLGRGAGLLDPNGRRGVDWL